MAGEAVVDTPVPITETPEFKEALKKTRDELEKTIRESNQAHLEDERKRLEALYGPPGGRPAATPTDGKDFFATWGEKHQLPPEAGLELAEGVIGYMEKHHIAQLSQAQRRSELRLQRQDVRASNPRLAKLDDKYHAEVEKLLETVAKLHPDSYTAALQLVIGRHFNDELEEDRKTRLPESPPADVKPGPTPGNSSPKPKGKVELTDFQKERALQMGLSEEDYLANIQQRLRGMKERGFSEAAIRQQLGKELGTLTI